MEYDDDDSIDSILTEIESSLQSGYPSIGERENQVVSAYHNDIRTVGYGRKDMESFLTYNNPFDPRLFFNGLGEHVHHPDINNEKYKIELTQNVFLALENPSQLMDKYLNGYRTYVRGLSGSPGSGDSTSVESRRLFDRISSDSVRSIWSKQTEQHSNSLQKKESVKNDNDVQIRSKNQKTRLAVRNRKKEEIRESDNKHHQCGQSKEVYSTSPKSQSMEQKPNFTTLKSQNKQPEVETTSDSGQESSAVITQVQRRTESWAGLFKTKTQKNSNSNEGLQSEEESTRTCVEDCSKGQSVVEKCPAKKSENYTDLEETKQNSEFFTSIEQLYSEYAPEQNIQANNLQPVIPPQSQENTQPQISTWSQGHDSNNLVYQHQFWMKQMNNQQPQPGASTNTYQLSTDYSKPQATFAHNVYAHLPPPPPGFSQMPPQNQQQVNSVPTTNYQQDQQCTGMYNDQQTLIYNLHKYLQPPNQIQTYQSNRYPGYQNQMKTQYGYQVQGNWNANNSNEYEGFSDDNNQVYYNQHSIEGKGYEEQPVREHKERPRCKTRNIRSNLIRIYPSKDN